jgi:tRNA pseudouridine38-40 synthase
MFTASRCLVGAHDFASFAAADDSSPSKRCTVEFVDWQRWARGVEMLIGADRFLHHMVRNLMGTLLEVGGGRREGASLSALLSAGDRRLAGPTAPAHGLTLLRVDYDASAWRFPPVVAP